MTTRDLLCDTCGAVVGVTINDYPRAGHFCDRVCANEVQATEVFKRARLAAHGRHIVTEADSNELRDAVIRLETARGRTSADLAGRFGLSGQRVRQIRAAL